MHRAFRTKHPAGCIRPILVLLLLLSAPSISAVCEQADAKLFDAPKQLTITFLGDCTLGSTPSTREDKSSFVSYVNRFGLSYPFSGVIDILRDDDLTVANLEGVFYNHEANRAEKTYNFRADTSWARILPLSSIEMVSVANNHISDYGERGYLSTVAALKENGTVYYGTNEYDDTAYLYEKDGIRIGFLAVNVSYWWSKTQVFRDAMARMTAMEPDVVIVSLHAGIAYDRRHDVTQDRIVSAFFGMGADIIIGHHPHVVQGIMQEDGKSCLYSLGNFAFGGNRALRSDACYMAQITLSFDENGEYLGHQINIIPCCPSSNTEFNDYRPVPVTGERAENVIKKIQYDTSFKLNPYIEGIGAVQDFIPAQCRFVNHIGQ